MMNLAEGVVQLSGRGSVNVLSDLEQFVAPEECRSLKCVVICDPTVAMLHADVRPTLERRMASVEFVVLEQSEPTAGQIEAAARRAIAVGAQMVVSVGGGSTIDTGKGVSQLLCGRRCLPEYFERPGAFESVAPHLVFPTTSGPGAEVSPAMVFANSKGRKIAVVDDRLVPRHVYILPKLIATLPRLETACCILDGVSHSIEGALRPDCSPAARIASTLVLRGFLSSMGKACEDQADLGNRERVAMLSLWSGEALRMTGVGAAHALASAVCDVVRAPHGLLVSTALVALLEEEPAASTRLAEFATEVGFNGIHRLVETISDYWRRFVACDHRSNWEPARDDVERLAAIAVADTRMAYHPSPIDARRAARAAKRILIEAHDHNQLRTYK